LTFGPAFAVRYFLICSHLACSFSGGTAMIGIDLVGLLLTIILTGPLYFIYTLIAVIMQELIRTVTALLVCGSLRDILLGGVLGAVILPASGQEWQSLVTLTGPLVCLLLALLCGFSLRKHGFRQLVNPFVRLQKPFATVQLRFAFLSLAVSLWQLLNWPA